MDIYTLTPAETAAYDRADDGPERDALMRDLNARFAHTDTKVVHPHGFLVEVYYAD